MRSRDRILTNLEEIYQAAFTRAAVSEDEARKEDLDNAYVRDQLMLEVLLDIRDLFSVAPAAPAPGKSALEHLEALRRITRPGR